MKEFIGCNMYLWQGRRYSGGRRREGQVGAGSDNMVPPFPFPTHTPTSFNR